MIMRLENLWCVIVLIHLRAYAESLQNRSVKKSFHCNLRNLNLRLK